MSETIIRQDIVSRLRKAGKDLYEVCSKVPEDRFNWSPVVDGHSGRPVEDQVHECAGICHWIAEAFSTKQVTAPDFSSFPALKAKHAGKDAALKWLQEGGEAMEKSLETYSDEDLNGTLIHPYTQETINWAAFADMVTWNMIYHEGQVNYVQTLYGDTSYP